MLRFGAQTRIATCMSNRIISDPQWALGSSKRFQRSLNNHPIESAVLKRVLCSRNKVTASRIVTSVLMKLVFLFFRGRIMIEQKG